MNGPIKNPHEQSLEKKQNWFQRLVEFGGGLVFIGLSVEYGPEIVHDIEIHSAPSIALIGGLAVTFGVLFETLFALISTHVSKELQGIADSRIAELHDRAAKAEKDAAEANLARIKIEEALFRPHVITDDVRDELIEILKAYAGNKRVDVFVYDKHIFEVFALADSITEVFGSAQWNSKLWIGAEPRMMGAEATFSVARECPTGTPENIALQQLAGRLSAVLFKLGVGSCWGVGGFSTDSSQLPNKPLGGWGIWDPADVAIFRVQIGQRQIFRPPVTPP